MKIGVEGGWPFIGGIVSVGFSRSSFGNCKADPMDEDEPPLCEEEKGLMIGDAYCEFNAAF